jgi:high-affinity iron transporter
VDAYLDGFELAEPALSVKDGRLVRELEARFVEFRTSIRSGAGIERIREIHGDLQARLAQTASALGSEPTGSGTYALFNAALIIIREGLEAALIVGAIVAVLKATGSIGAVRYVHLGWILALLAGIVTWALAQTVLTVSGAQREVMEGLTSVIAALVLFWASYWLISKAEAKKWQKYIHEKVQEAVTGRRITALVGVSFLAVYREAFETVLFYQALWVQTPAARGQVIWGFLAGVALLALLVFTLFRLGLRIPLRHFFGASSVFLYLLAFVFAGQGIKDLQAAGWLSETPLYLLPRIPWLGIYPTVETFMAQAVMIAALVVALLWLGRGRWLGARVKQA